MLPLLPFAVGLVTGAIVVKLLRNEKTRDGLEKVQEKARIGLEKAQDKLRDATISGLAAVESSSAAMKRRLSADKAAMEETAPEVNLPAETAADQPAAPEANQAAETKS